MASNPLLLFFFFFLLTTLHAHARDSYVFSKVSRNRDDDSTAIPSNTLYNNNDNENEVTPSFEQQKLDEEQPSFVPQTTHSNYGLYGHETTLVDNTYENQNNFNNNNEYINENQNNYNNNENINENVEYSNGESKYVPQLSESSYTNDVVGPTNYVAQNDLNNNDNNDNNNNNENDDGNGEGKYYGSTRYNGRKNFYDVDGETKFDAYLRNMELSYSKNHNSNNVNKNGKLYGNNYYNGNAMNNQGYRNEFPQEEEFDFDDQP
ncbi:hypothetical protein vseg_011425 [Gypsophila vaccaria]